jgi:hypothetical protein
VVGVYVAADLCAVVWWGGMVFVVSAIVFDYLVCDGSKETAYGFCTEFVVLWLWTDCQI